MKHILHSSVVRQLVLSISVFSGLSAMAHTTYREESELHLSVWNNRSFTVELDGKAYRGHQTLQLNGLYEGSHRLKVYRDEPSHYVSLYNGVIDIPESSTIMAEITRERDFRILRIERNGCNNDCGNGPQRPPVANTSCTTSRPVHGGRPQGVICSKPAQSTGCNDDNGYYNNDQYNGLCDRPEIVSVEIMQNILRAMDNSWSEDERLLVSMKAIHNRQLTAEQIKTIMTKFWFEDSRLEFAKFAYSHCRDRQDYYVVNEAFWFLSSRQSLRDFIESQCK